MPHCQAFIFFTLYFKQRTITDLIVSIITDFCMELRKKYFEEIPGITMSYRIEFLFCGLVEN